MISLRRFKLVERMSTLQAAKGHLWALSFPALCSGCRCDVKCIARRGCSRVRLQNDLVCRPAAHVSECRDMGIDSDLQVPAQRLLVVVACQIVFRSGLVTFCAGCRRGRH